MNIQYHRRDQNEMGKMKDQKDKSVGGEGGLMEERTLTLPVPSQVQQQLLGN